MNRVAVTGIGTINSIAKNTKEFSESLKNDVVGIDMITQFDTSDHKVKIASEIKNFEPKNYMDKKVAKRYDRFLQLALVASKEAIEDAKFKNDDWKENTAVIIGSGIGGFKTLFSEFEKFSKKGAKMVSPFLIPMMIPDMVSGAVAIEHKLKGPNFSTVSACASSLNAIANSAMLIKHGYINVAVTGGSEAVISPMPIAAFANMQALSTRNDDPKTASRPFDKDRDGFVMGEGSGILILESEEHAKARGAKIYGYIDGFGLSGDGYHISATDPEGAGAVKAMEMALKTANAKPEDIDMINCHGTSTPVGDVSEIKAIKQVFGSHTEKLLVQSTKGHIGHNLGAAGAIELIAVILQSNEEFIHGMPTIQNIDGKFEDLNITLKTKNGKVKKILKNAFGFGGHNASILFVKEDN
ncbi:3-oxoacyl-[acyl-carrier-protein] synthase 2 [Tepiditoga spiralis]|uniref:3-oxoacyl-[acyl-carrier-protein] synthase 2 n=1 Tax=Tepiditoga spiralis TaxID=2108365 RepID=A0A7G1G2G7_9BACT|nr:beta-ketoacyl-ACP synthase II [Tepiditoga spiralis]BBE30521.1 3-oxoacyl-[acyl-carrier-protein] synthase 2 [Tepiditoga spiralis]